MLQPPNNFPKICDLLFFTILVVLDMSIGFSSFHKFRRDWKVEADEY